MKSEVQAAQFFHTVFPSNLLVGPALENLFWIWVPRSRSILRLGYCVVLQLLRVCSVRVHLHRWRLLRSHHRVCLSCHRARLCRHLELRKGTWLLSRGEPMAMASRWDLPVVTRPW